MAKQGMQRKPYIETTLKRTTQYVFEKGKPMFELVDERGQVYVMQSYALMVDKHLTYEQLPSLGERLKLPAGWRYQVRVPEEGYALRTVGGAAHVLQDDLMNTYQRVDTP